MPITEIKKSKRPNTTMPFFPDSGLPAVVAAKEAAAPFYANGSLVTTESVSNDGLTLTRTQTFSDLSVYSAYDTSLSMALDAAFLKYYGDVGSLYTESDTYTQTGIDAPFTCTTVYTFPSSESELRDWIIDAINNDGKGKLSDLDVTETTLTVVHQYNNSADFTANHYADLRFTPEMHAAGFTRSITYT